MNSIDCTVLVCSSVLEMSRGLGVGVEVVTWAETDLNQLLKGRIKWNYKLFTNADALRGQRQSLLVSTLKCSRNMAIIQPTESRNLTHMHKRTKAKRWITSHSQSTIRTFALFPPPKFKHLHSEQPLPVNNQFSRQGRILSSLLRVERRPYLSSLSCSHTASDYWGHIMSKYDYSWLFIIFTWCNSFI